MKLNIAGGCGEHGRNCFHVVGDHEDFLVDCGLMAGEPGGGFPRLSREEIPKIQAVLLTHSHADHTGALPWLYQNGFQGTVIAARATLEQLPFALTGKIVLENICPGGEGEYQGIRIRWGRSGHCVGSVWYRFEVEGKTVLFSGDYTEDTQVYACDPIRNQTADLAVLDCAYGKNETTYNEDCSKLVSRTKELLEAYPVLVFPVPKYGRGLELLRLFEAEQLQVPFYGDAHFLREAEKMTGDHRFWCKSAAGTLFKQVQPITERQGNGILFLSDPQLRSDAAREAVQNALSAGGHCVMTGTAEKGSYSARLLERGKMEFLRYPVHLNEAQYQALKARNQFKQTIPYHSPEMNPGLVFPIK